jgi:hypothetical protein
MAHKGAIFAPLFHLFITFFAPIDNKMTIFVYTERGCEIL